MIKKHILASIGVAMFSGVAWRIGSIIGKFCDFEPWKVYFTICLLLVTAWALLGYSVYCNWEAIQRELYGLNDRRSTRRFRSRRS